MKKLSCIDRPVALSNPVIKRHRSSSLTDRSPFVTLRFDFQYGTFASKGLKPATPCPPRALSFDILRFDIRFHSSSSAAWRTMAYHAW